MSASLCSRNRSLGTLEVRTCANLSENFQNAHNERVRATSQPKSHSLELWDDSIKRSENDAARRKSVRGLGNECEPGICSGKRHRGLNMLDNLSPVGGNPASHE